MNTVKNVEETLRHAFETALEEGFYPQDGTYGNNLGGCCALGVLGVVENYYDPVDGNAKMCDNDNYAELLGVSEQAVEAVINGFDGSIDDGDEHAEYEGKLLSFERLGRRLRRDYFLCDGKSPFDAEVK